MPDAILMDIIKDHLPYEIDMLRHTYTQLSVVSKVKLECENDEQKATRFALTESFCVHARSLIDFFANANTKRDGTDAIASEFTDGFTPIRLDESVKTIRDKKLNKQIFHLTKNRTIIDSNKFDAGRDGMDVLKIIEPAIERFTNCLLPGFRSHFKCTTTPLLVTNLLPAFASTTAVFAGTVKQATV
jgi:hypothetical protein